jgi:putative toxin-antitoxin system antitoxin component (TIGR02293 family)
MSGKNSQRSRASRKRQDATTDDPVLRSARIVVLAVKVIEDEGRAARWLSRAQIGLGGQIPLDMMTTAAGCEQVEKLLLRIEHGVYS